MKNIGEVILEIPPSKGNPRNSEGAFITLRDGRILLIYSRFIGDSASDTALACIAGRCSSDGGNTWSDDRIFIMPEEDNAMNIMSVSLLRMENGDIGLLYGIRYGWHDARLHLRRSSDEGETWSKPMCCIPCPGYFVVNNDRVVRLSSGRIIIPAAFHRIAGESTVDWNSFDHRGIALFFFSDDDGRTWRESRNFCTIPASRSLSGLQEPGVIELKNGMLWAWNRTDMGRQYEMFSMDMGETWSLPEPSVFTSPCSPLSMKRIPGDGSLLAVWNPTPYSAKTSWRRKLYRDRSPLVASLSRDDGKTWSEYVVLEDNKDGGYCYTSIFFTDEAVFLAYCAGEKEDGDQLAKLRVRKILLKDIL